MFQSVKHTGLVSFDRWIHPIVTCAHCTAYDTQYTVQRMERLLVSVYCGQEMTTERRGCNLAYFMLHFIRTMAAQYYSLGLLFSLFSVLFTVQKTSEGVTRVRSSEGAKTKRVGF